MADAAPAAAGDAPRFRCSACRRPFASASGLNRHTSGGKCGGIPALRCALCRQDFDTLSAKHVHVRRGCRRDAAVTSGTSPAVGRPAAAGSGGSGGVRDFRSEDVAHITGNPRTLDNFVARGAFGALNAMTRAIYADDAFPQNHTVLVPDDVDDDHFVIRKRGQWVRELARVVVFDIVTDVMSALQDHAAGEACALKRDVIEAFNHECKMMFACPVVRDPNGYWFLEMSVMRMLLTTAPRA